MTRGFGEVEGLQALLGGFVPAFAVVTLLGSRLVYLPLLLGLFWFAHRVPVLGDGVDREEGALLLALGVGALALTVALKAAFALPRPPGAGVPVGVEVVPTALRPAYAAAATADGYGFPSGHAIGTTVVYGGFAWRLGAGTRRTRALLAAGIVAAVSLSRVVLGLHYGVDVLAGVLLGLGYLALVARVAAGPGRAFGLAAVVAVLGTLLAGPSPDLLAAVGATAGGALAWRAVGDALPPVDAGRAALVAAGAGLLASGGLYLLVWLGLERGAPVLLGNAAVMGATLALPLPLARLERRLAGT